MGVTACVLMVTSDGSTALAMSPTDTAPPPVFVSVTTRSTGPKWL